MGLVNNLIIYWKQQESPLKCLHYSGLRTSACRFFNHHVTAIINKIILYFGQSIVLRLVYVYISDNCSIEHLQCKIHWKLWWASVRFVIKKIPMSFSAFQWGPYFADAWIFWLIEFLLFLSLLNHSLFFVTYWHNWSNKFWWPK